MSYLYQSRLFDDSGALQVVMADTIPLSQPRYEEWAADSEGRSFVAYAPAVLPVTARRISISGLGGISLAVNTTGAVYVTDGSAARVTSDELFEGVRIRKDGVLYMSAVSTAVVPVVVKRAKGLNTDANGSVVVGGLSFLRTFPDAGSGVANLTEGIGVGAATFTRSGATASTIGSTGLVIKGIAADTPRSYYDPTSLAYLGYLPEGARTNIAIQSEDFSNAAWTKNTVTVTADNTTAPDGTLTADRLTAGGANQIYAPGLTVVSNSQNTWSVFLKSGTGSTALLVLSDSGSLNGATVSVDLAAGTVGTPAVLGTGTGQVATIKAHPNGWYRVSLSVNINSAVTSAFPQIFLTAGGATTLFAWGAQLEAGAFASTYIPTVGATVTRNADVLTYPTSPWYNALTSTLFAQYVRSGAANADSATEWAATIGDGTANNFIAIGSTPGDTAIVLNGGVTQAALSGGAASTPLSARKLAAAIQANNFALSGNGSAAVTDVAGTVPTVTTLYIGQRGDGNQFLNGPISRVGVLNYRSKDGNLTIMSAA